MTPTLGELRCSELQMKMPVACMHGQKWPGRHASQNIATPICKSVQRNLRLLQLYDKHHRGAIFIVNDFNAIFVL